jgi:hypothetical protein
MSYPKDIIPKTSLKWVSYINFYYKRAWRAEGKKGYSFTIYQNEKFKEPGDKVKHIQYQVHYRGNPMTSGGGKSVAYYMIELPKMFPRRKRP